MTAGEWKALWQQEESHAFSGWDFSHIRDRYQTEPLPWDYEKKVRDFLRPGVRLLDLATGGGELLLSLGHPPQLTAVTEDWEPNYRLCRQRLEPLGIRVERGAQGSALPFADNSFDLVLCRHGSYDVAELCRVLQNGGFFVTQQVGGQNGRWLGKRLLPEWDRPGQAFNLENEAPKFQKAGFRMMSMDQAYPMGRFYDVGALCFHAKHVPWEFPGFSVESCLGRLLELQAEIETRGFVENQEHRFFLIAKNKK